MTPHVENVRIGCPKCNAIVVATTSEPYHALTCDRCASLLFLKGPLRLSDIGFEAHALDASMPLLVAFGAEWCGPFNRMKATLDDAAHDLEPELRLVVQDEALNGPVFE